MITGCRSTGALPVKHTMVVIIGINTFLQLSNQLLPWHIKRDFQQPAAIIETIQMILLTKDLIVGKCGCIIAAISKINRAIQHRNFHFLQYTNLSIIISYILHIYFSFHSLTLSDILYRQTSLLPHKASPCTGLAKYHIIAWLICSSCG